MHFLVFCCVSYAIYPRRMVLCVLCAWLRCKLFTLSRFCQLDTQLHNIWMKHASLLQCCQPSHKRIRIFLRKAWFRYIYIATKTGSEISWLSFSCCEDKLKKIAKIALVPHVTHPTSTPKNSIMFNKDEGRKSLDTNLEGDYQPIVNARWDIGRPLVHCYYL